MADTLGRYCIPKPTGEEVVVATKTAANEILPTAYTDCHSHPGEEV